MQNIYLLFNSDIVDFLFKTNRGRDRRPNFVVFVVWSVLLLVGGVEQKVLLGAGYFPGIVQGLGLWVGSRFHLLVPDFYKGNEEVGWVQYFFCVTPAMERYSLDIPQAAKK